MAAPWRIARKDIERLENTSPAVFGGNPMGPQDSCTGVSLCESLTSGDPCDASVCQVTVNGCPAGHTSVVCVFSATTCVDNSTACVDESTTCNGQDTACTDGSTACTDGSTACNDGSTACVNAHTACVDQSTSCLEDATSCAAFSSCVFTIG